MVDVPTPSEIAEEVEEGNEPTSLGDVARANRDPSTVEDVVPDTQDSDPRDR